MAWQWTDVKQIEKGAYRVTATESITLDTISIVAHKDRVSPVLLAQVLKEKVAALNARRVDEENKLAWAIANIDISEVE